MNEAAFMELSARCEALSRIQLALMAQLEDRHLVQGDQFRSALLSILPAGSPVLDRSAELIREMVQKSAAASLRR